MKTLLLSAGSLDKFQGVSGFLSQADGGFVQPCDWASALHRRLSPKVSFLEEDLYWGMAAQTGGCHSNLHSPLQISESVT